MASAAVATALGLAGLVLADAQESFALGDDGSSGGTSAPLRTVYGWVRPAHDFQATPEENAKKCAIVLISDVDETMTGSNDALDAFNEWWLREQVPRNSCLIYNTARPCGLGGISHSNSGFTQLVKSGRYDLMRPDVLITCEGTEIFWLDADQNTPARRDLDWHEHLAEHWEQDVVEKRLCPHDEGLVKALGVTGPFNSDDTFRFAVTIGDKERAIDLAERVQEDLGPHYHVFWTEAWVRGIYLVSVLPSSAGKGNAAEYAAFKVGIDLEHTVWAGDSDNDLQMLNTHALKGIVVGNSFSERLRAAASQDSRARFYQATAWNAAGVMEGLAFIFPEMLSRTMRQQQQQRAQQFQPQQPAVAGGGAVGETATA